MSDVIRQIGDRLEPVLRDAFLAAVERLRTNIDEVALRAAIRDGRIDHALKIMGISEGSFPALETTLMTGDANFHDTMGLAFIDAGTAAAAAFIVFDRSAARPSLDRLRVSILIEIVEDSARALQGVIGGSKGPLTTPDAVAKKLRDTLGLTPAQARGLSLFGDALESAAERLPIFTTRLIIGNSVREKTTALGIETVLRPDVIRHLSASQRAILRQAISSGTLTPDTIDRLVERQRQILLRHRADAIARTEAARMTNAGEHEAWLQAAARGEINSETARRFWVTAGDERVRENHRAVPLLNPNGVRLDEPFKTPFGPVMFPPLEIGCRCRVVLRQGKPS